MKLKGSKTEENLKAAFAGESQANRKYLAFAIKDESAQVRSAAIRAVEGKGAILASGSWGW